MSYILILSQSRMKFIPVVAVTNISAKNSNWYNSNRKQINIIEIKIDEEVEDY